MKSLRSRVFRLPIVAIAAFAWLAISNHCALGAVKGAVTTRMPSCHSAPAQQSPSQGNNQSAVECCKVLRATLLTLSSDLPSYNAFTFASNDFAVALHAPPEGAQFAAIIEWDTGPPGLRSFVELVLQRSILAHAPPSLA